MGENRKLKGFPITFNLYAFDEEEVERCRKALVEFIGLHAVECRAVTAEKVERAVKNWDKNPFVKSQIINYFK